MRLDVRCILPHQLFGFHRREAALPGLRGRRKTSRARKELVEWPVDAGGCWRRLCAIIVGEIDGNSHVGRSDGEQENVEGRERREDAREETDLKIGSRSCPISRRSLTMWLSGVMLQSAHKIGGYIWG